MNQEQPGRFNAAGIAAADQRRADLEKELGITAQDKPGQVTCYDAEGTREVMDLAEHMIFYHTLDCDWETELPGLGPLNLEHEADHRDAIAHRVYEGQPGSFILHIHPREGQDGTEAPA